MKCLRVVCLSATLLLASSVADAGEIDVMTQNQYLGADLTPIVEAQGDPIAFNQAVLNAISEIAANDFSTRAGLLAELIAGRLPALVGLQEVFEFVCADLPTQTGPGCSDPSIAGAFNDHLALTLSALGALGADYEEVARVENLFIPIPADTDFSGQPDILVTTIDHDVILARGDLETPSPVDYSVFCPGRMSLDGCNYEAAAMAGAITVLRGWVGVDATVGGKDYRFVNTHLEVQMPSSDPASPAIQAFQAAELIGVLAASTPPSRSLIVVGDINSSPNDPFIPGPFPLPPPFDQGIVPPYSQFVAAGYTDSWSLRGRVPGFSCCQLADLSNIASLNDERIDVILSEEVPSKVKKARVLGDNVPDKGGPFGLWPSDHGSVAAELQFH